MAIERTKTPANPPQLESEIRAIRGFPQHGLSVYVRGPETAYIYFDGDLPGKLLNDFDRAIDSHIPNWDARNDENELRLLIDTLPTTYENFDPNTVPLRMLAQIVKSILRLLILYIRKQP